MHSTIILDLFSIIPLLFTISLANRHRLQNPRNRYYMLASMATIVLLLCEIYALQKGKGGGLSSPALSRVIHMVGFALSPLIPFYVTYFIGKSRFADSQKFWFSLPLASNLLLSVLSLQTGWLFRVDSQDLFSRGPLFPFTIVVSLFYFATAVVWTFRARYTFEIADKVFLASVTLLPLISIGLQTAIPQFRILWGSVSMSLLLFYIFTLELNFEYDNQTEVRNREGFERAMQQMVGKDTTLFVFDLNNLKKTNDLHGHRAGDALLFDAAKTIEEVFKDHGSVFRIGGDKFCVLSNFLSADEAANLITRLMERIERSNSSRAIPIDLAYGYTAYQPRKRNSIFAAFSQADNAMYEQKAKYKQSMGMESQR